MKKLSNYLIVLALMAFTFTSCEDVPSPFGEIVKPESNSGVVIEPSGSGTEADPYNVAAVIEYVTGLGADVQSDKEVYIKGYCIEATDISTKDKFNNATFVMSDTPDGGNKFTVYRAKGLGGDDITDANLVKVGDVVVVCGKVVNYKGNTPETVQGAAYIVSVNGTGGGSTPTPDTETIGTKEAPISTSEALTQINALEEGGKSKAKAYVKGKIVKIATNAENFAKYGNINYWISDDGTETNQVQVYAGDGLNGDKFSSLDDIAAGDEVVVFGTLYKYVNKSGQATPEIEGSYLVSLTKGQGGGDTPVTPTDGNGTLENPLTVAQALTKAGALPEIQNASEVSANNSIADAVVKGVITNVKSIDTGQWGNAEYTIADAAGSTSTLLVYRGFSLGGEKFTKSDEIKENDVVIIQGTIVNFRGTLEFTSGSKILSLNGNTSGGGGGDTPSDNPSTATSLQNGDFETWANGLPSFWKSASTASSANLSQSTDAHGGSYSVKVAGDEGSNKRLASQEITLAAGNYTFTFYAKATTGDKAQVRPGYVPVTNGSAGSYAYGGYADINNNGWTKVSYDFKLDSEKTVCLVVMNPKASDYSSGKDVLIDDATLTKK